MNAPELCGGTIHEGRYYTCGRAVLLRDATRPEAGCPDGLVVCDRCADPFADFMRRAYDARARRKEWEED